MEWSVQSEDGTELYRGPEWAARFRAERRYQDWPENRRWLEDATALGHMMLEHPGRARDCRACQDVSA